MASRSVIVAPDVEAQAEAAAERLVARLAAAHGLAAVALTGGSAPLPLYKLLPGERFRKAIAWERVHWFMGDDRFVPVDDPLSNMGAARKAFLDASAPPMTIHAIDASGADVRVAAQAYSDALMQFRDAAGRADDEPLFDVCLLGVGVDGHVASLFPGAPELDERDRLVVGVDEAGQEPHVPRVSLTLPALNSTREMLFLVNDKKKRNVVARILRGEDLPATRVKPHGAVAWLLTADVAEGLPDEA